jgi:MoxR-like ATPase|tara:strand:- start:3468 stop:4448 length:981 start_codon:yes stop_codon:yes gene_type:complete
MKNKKGTEMNLTTTANFDIKKFLDTCKDLRPSSLIMDDTKWKYMVRSTIRGKNILLLGPTGCGKTLAAQTVAKVVGKENKFFYFNLGATQDARASLIGNTHFDKSSGTFFKESSFVKAIRTPNAIILLDEISRSHHDGVNILMTVLDDLQRYLRLDEKEDSEIVKVADGVTFIATANVGNEYTATRVMDRALLSRFPVKIEMTPLDRASEFELLKNRFNITDAEKIDMLNAVCDIADHTRKQVKMEDSKINNFLPTRSTVEIAELIVDGFNLLEIAETTIYPNFSEDGGVDSERTYIRQLVQKYIKTETKTNLFNDPIKESSTVPF